MYKGNNIMQIAGVILSLGFIILMVWYMNSKIPKTLKGKDWLTRFVALTLTAMLGLFIVDVLISWDVQLLKDSLRDSLFELIKNIVLVVFGYQFSQLENKDPENNNDINQ